jgi:Glycosyl hydrolase family 10
VNASRWAQGAVLNSLSRLKRWAGCVGLATLACTAPGWPGDAVAQPTSAEVLYRLPPLPGREIDLSYFGTHLHAFVLRGRVQDPPQATPFPVGQVGAIRLWDSVTRWGEVEPESGRFVFDRVDKYVDAAARHGASVLFTLGSTPRWASARPDEPCSYGFGCAAEPADMAHWERYIQTLARRYKGKVAYYEVWNEPHPGQVFQGHRGFYTGNLASLVELARRAKKVLSVEDPQAVLLTPGFVNRLPLLERYLAEGGAQWAQGLAYHLYASGDRQFLEQLRELRAILARQGVSHWPILNTESGFDRVDPLHPAPPGFQPRDANTAAALHARVLILGAFAGLKASYQHGWDNGASGMVTRDLKPTPTLAAHTDVLGFLLGVKPLGCALLTGAAAGVVRCEGQLPKSKGEQQVQLMWLAAAGPEVWVPLDPRAHTAQTAGAGAPAPVKAGVLVGFAPVAVWLAAP